MHPLSDPRTSRPAWDRKRRGSRGGRPVGYDRDDFRGRNVIERRLCHLKPWRELATCSVRLALVNRADPVLNAVIDETRALSNRPRRPRQPDRDAPDQRLPQ
ncbi:transposase [Pseudoclavibacter sp. VKM Ac-2888]|nr:transposase [Pseudoclavibacter sp. VKM Ac-2888]